MEDNRRETVCAVVVTYNRKKLLRECLDALLSQTRPLDSIIIIDNASSDGTEEFLEENYLYNPVFDYVRLPKNTGGAGGFHEGVKRGYERGFDWLWLMDDDGKPDKLALYNLVQMSMNYNPKVVLNCLVVNKNNADELAFSVRINDKPTCTYIKVQQHKGIINGGNPFNGTFIPSAVIRKIGFPNKAYFVYGDEKDYAFRIQEHYQFLTCKDAIIYHPKPVTVKRRFLGRSITVEKNQFKAYYRYRNMIWLHLKYGGRYKALKIARLALHALVEVLFVDNKRDRMSSAFGAITRGLRGR